MATFARHQEVMAAVRLAQEQGQLATDEALLKAGTRKDRLLAEMLYGEKGIQSLRAEGPSPAFQGSKSAGTELKDLQRLLWQYKSWAHGICPDKASEQFIAELRDVPSIKIVSATQELEEKQRVEALPKHAGPPAPAAPAPYAAYPVAPQPAAVQQAQAQPAPQAPQAVPPAMDEFMEDEELVIGDFDPDDPAFDMVTDF
ncbi:hypothetical protein DIPPA_23232 [Diplonema papillatum]|nr:hypothetical protein DIPPA_23232 [Diplonema papillatum]